MKRSWMLCLSAVAALFAAACSNSGGSTIGPPPPNNGFSNNSLMGQYAFSMSGTAGNSTTGQLGPYSRVGSFIADGKGGIEGGVEDVNLILVGEGANELGITGGSYTVNSDGRGTLSLIDSTGTLTFSISLSSPSNGYIVDLPTDGLSSASGNFVLQNTNSFSLAAFNGSYAFDFSGADSAGNPESIVGQLVSTGNQTLSGFADDNDANTINGGSGGASPLSISGNYSSPTVASDLTSFGRGQFTIGGLSGVFYIVGPNQVKFMEEASGGTLAGDALLQSANLPTTAAGLGGSFVYVMGGAAVLGSGGALTRGGKISASGGNLSSIVVDSNDGGTLNSSTATTGTYTIDPSGDGRGTISFTVSGLKDPFTYVFYLVSPTQAVVQDQGLGIVEDGTMFAQGSGTISASSIAGNYAINWSGVDIANGGNAEGEEDLIGEATLSSADAITGNVDINEFATGAQATGVGLSGNVKLSSDPTTHNAVTFNLATNPNGTVSAFAYIAANNNILFVSTTSSSGTRVVAGVMTPQNP